MVPHLDSEAQENSEMAHVGAQVCAAYNREREIERGNRRLSFPPDPARDSNVSPRTGLLYLKTTLASPVKKVGKVEFSPLLT